MRILKKFLPEIVYGGIDGLVTTFAVVAGSLGANVSLRVALILGICNLLADGLSMATGAYLSHKTKNNEQVKKALEVGGVTYLAFLMFGIVPLLGIILAIFTNLGLSLGVIISFVLTLVGFVVLGYIRAFVEKSTIIRSIAITLIIGTTVAILAYVVGDILSKYLITTL
jgi:vacuolar iron transporter family protein